MTKKANKLLFYFARNNRVLVCSSEKEADEDQIYRKNTTKNPKISFKSLGFPRRQPDHPLYRFISSSLKVLCLSKRIYPSPPMASQGMIFFSSLLHKELTPIKKKRTLNTLVQV